LICEWPPSKENLAGGCFLESFLDNLDFPEISEEGRSYEEIVASHFVAVDGVVGVIDSDWGEFAEERFGWCPSGWIMVFT
jgi:hypothetical protein